MESAEVPGRRTFRSNGGGKRAGYKNRRYNQYGGYLEVRIAETARNMWMKFNEKKPVPMCDSEEVSGWPGMTI